MFLYRVTVTRVLLLLFKKGENCSKSLRKILTRNNRLFHGGMAMLLLFLVSFMKLTIQLPVPTPFQFPTLEPSTWIAPEPSSWKFCGGSFNQGTDCFAATTHGVDQCSKRLSTSEIKRFACRQALT